MGGGEVKRPSQPFDLVEIVWDDAAGQEAGWANTVTITPELVLTAGFLVYCKRDYIVIASDVDGDGYHNGRTQIPRGMVKSMKVLRRKD